MPIDPVTGALLGGGMDLLGGIGANIFSAAEAAKSRKFARKSMLNRYQWTVHDLEEAGLNPIMALGGQPPAQTGAQAAAHPISGVINSARTGSRLADELKILKNEVHNSHARVGKTYAETANIEDQALLARSNRKVAEATARRTNVLRKLDESYLPAADIRKRTDQAPLGQVLRMINRALRGVFGQKD